MHKGQIKWNGLNSKLEGPDVPKSDLKVAELRGGPKHVNNPFGDPTFPTRPNTLRRPAFMDSRSAKFQSTELGPDHAKT